MRVPGLCIHVLLFLLHAVPSLAVDYYVDSVGGNDANSGTSITAPWQSLWKIDGRAFGPGDRILLKRGSVWDSILRISGSAGTATAPIVVAPYGEGAMPRVLGGGQVLRTSYLTIQELEISNGASGVAIAEGSSHITVRDCVLHHNNIGVWIGDNAGCSNLVLGSSITWSNYFGLSVDGVNCGPGTETRISGNEIAYSVWDGLNIKGDWYIIEYNTVHDNGYDAATGTDDMVGHSGIHLFSRYSPDAPDHGDYNVIRYNIVYHSRDFLDWAYDGHGILVDQWCDNNQIYGNLCIENDGGGIAVYDAQNNRVFNNTAHNNGVHPRNPDVRAQILLTATPTYNRCENNQVINNIGSTTHADRLAVTVDYFSAGRNVFSHNLWYNSSGGDWWVHALTRGRDLATWTALSGAVSPLYADPRYQDAAGYDFSLSPGSPAVNSGLDMGLPYKGPAPDRGFWESNSAGITGVYLLLLRERGP